MTDNIATMTDMDIHDEVAALFGVLTFEQEVDRMMHFNQEVYGTRLNCERIYKRKLAENRTKQVEVLRRLRAEEIAGKAVTP